MNNLKFSKSPKEGPCTPKGRGDRLPLSKFVLKVATCSTQTVNQITNVAAEVCKVAIKRTSGFSLIQETQKYGIDVH